MTDQVGRPRRNGDQDPASPDWRRVQFVTGRLAEPALQRVLAEMAPDFAYDVTAMGITVAALMTTDWIARALTVPEGTDLVLIPGLCEGDPQVIAEKVGVSVEKGPKDLREIPHYFGSAATRRDYGAWDIEIVAEINNVPRLSLDAVRISSASNVSTLTRTPAPARPRTTSPSAGKATPGVQPISITSAPDARK